MNLDQEPKKLQSLKNVAPRNPQAAARGRARFLAQAKNFQAVPADPIPRHNRWNIFAQARRPRFASFALAMLLAILFIVSGTSAAVYAAQDALPNDALYPVKLWSEDARVNLAPDAATRADLLLDFANRRANEMVASSTANPAVVERAQMQLEAAMQIVAQLDDASLTRVLTKAEKQLAQQAQPIEQMQARELMKTQREWVRLGLQNQNEFRERVNADKGYSSSQPAAVEKPTTPPNPTDVDLSATVPAVNNDSPAPTAPGNSNASPAHGTPPAEPPGKSNGNPPAEPPGKSVERTPPGNAPDRTPVPPTKRAPEESQTKVPPGQTRRP